MNAMQADIKYKAYYDKKPTPHISTREITFTSYSRNQIIKEVKFPSRVSGGLGRILL